MKRSLVLLGLMGLVGLWMGRGVRSFGQTTDVDLPHVVARISLSHKTTTVPATIILKPATNGLYRISAYMVQPFPTSSSCGDSCGALTAMFQWTDDGGTQVMNADGIGASFVSPIGITLGAAPGQGIPSCAPIGVCTPAHMSTNDPGATFVVRVNAGTPLIYSITGEVGSGLSYDFFATVEKLM